MLLQDDTVGVCLDLCRPAPYRIVVQGCLDAQRAQWFDDMTMTTTTQTTTLIGVVADQSALHGLLTRVRDLGLPLLLVEYAGH